MKIWLEFALTFVMRGAVWNLGTVLAFSLDKGANSPYEAACTVTAAIYHSRLIPVFPHALALTSYETLCD